jgi:hypothetical protein
MEINKWLERGHDYVEKNKVLNVKIGLLNKVWRHIIGQKIIRIIAQKNHRCEQFR